MLDYSPKKLLFDFVEEIGLGEGSVGRLAPFFCLSQDLTFPRYSICRVCGVESRERL